MSGGLYVVLVRVTRPTEVTVRRCRYPLPPGWYVYAGSARRGLHARVTRHVRRKKPVRWHIDHLTTNPAATTLGALLFEGSGDPGGAFEEIGAAVTAAPRRVDTAPLSECLLNRAVGLIVGGDAPVKGFGSSDCRSGCPAHLWRSDRRLTLDGLAADLADLGIARPTVLPNPRAAAEDVVDR